MEEKMTPIALDAELKRRAEGMNPVFPIDQLMRPRRSVKTVPAEAYAGQRASIAEHNAKVDAAKRLKKARKLIRKLKGGEK